MANIINAGTSFPPEIAEEVFNLVKGESALAKLSDQKPIHFSGDTFWTFNLDSEAAIVGESAQKTNGGATVGQITIKPLKFEYGFRVSNEFVIANDEQRADILRGVPEAMAKKMARALDIAALHGVNPRTGTPSPLIGANHFDRAAESDGSATITGTANPDADIQGAISAIAAQNNEVTGAAISPIYASQLAALKDSTGRQMFPELGYGVNVSSIKGLPVAVNSTVPVAGSGGDRAVVGDFRNRFRWGVAAEIPFKVIEYGNPDNDNEAGDLQGSNQVYLRSEVFFGWGILDFSSFVRIINA
ncbi:MAG: phage major capsid protein [Clostridiales Family XIII bacterium]|jgi:HK97 family phage major capsid protein|nr:phage major capsid protein [Clostridiales Family XIII bacterium]